MCQESWLRCPQKAAVKVTTAVSSHGRRICLEVHLCSIVRIQFLEDCWSEGLSPRLAVSWRLLSDPSHVDFSQHDVFASSEKLRRAKSTKKIDVTVFYSLILEVTFHIFANSFYYRNKSLGPNYIKGKRIPGGRNHLEPCQKLPTSTTKCNMWTWFEFWFR